MLLVSWVAVYRFKKHGDVSQILAITLVLMTFSGWVATISGWYVTEIGRQPWLVNGILKTADATSLVSGGMIGISLTMYLIVYIFLLVAFISTIFHMARKAGEKIDQEPPIASSQAVVEAIN